jgi:hypothetical protein
MSNDEIERDDTYIRSLTQTQKRANTEAESHITHQHTAHDIEQNSTGEPFIAVFTQFRHQSARAATDHKHDRLHMSFYSSVRYRILSNILGHGIAMFHGWFSHQLPLGSHVDGDAFAHAGTLWGVR